MHLLPDRGAAAAALLPSDRTGSLAAAIAERGRSGPESNGLGRSRPAQLKNDRGRSNDPVEELGKHFDVSNEN